MSRIAAGPVEGVEQGYRPYLQAALLMGLFTFLFLCTEYLYVDVLSRMVSGDRAVLAQNEALGVSAVGFLLYPLAERFGRERLRPVLTGLAGLLSMGCILLICGGTAYRVTFPAGLVFFLLFGLLGGAVFTAAVALMPTDRYLARTVGASYALGILLQFLSNNLVRRELAEGIVLSVCLLLLVGLLMKSHRACGGETEQRQETGKERTVGLLLVLLVALMTCVFSTLDNAVTLVHSSGEMDIGQWPRALLALSGLSAGFVFDWKGRKYMGPIMYCVMLLSTICIAVLKLAGPFLVGLMVFYLSAGFFVVFFTAGFMELARRMRVPGLWAGMGRAVNNLTAAVIAGPVLTLLSAEGSLGVIVLALLLFAVTSVAAMGYTMQRRALLEQPSAAPTDALDEAAKLRRLAETYALTERETQVLSCLVQTEDNLQTIAETLYVSRRTLERYVSAIYEKTGAKSRVGLLNLYNK